MYPKTPENEKTEYFSENTTPSEQQSPPTYPSPQPTPYYPNIHPYHNHHHHHGPRWYHNPYNGYNKGFSPEKFGFLPPPPPPPHPHLFGHNPRSNDPFFFENKHHKKDKKRYFHKALIGTSIVCSSLIFFNLGRGYEFSLMKQGDLHHHQMGHPHAGPHMHHEYDMEFNRNHGFHDKNFGQPGKFGTDHHDFEKLNLGFRPEFIGGTSHGKPHHGLGENLDFRPLDDHKGPPPSFPEYGENHGKIHHQKPDGKSNGKGSHKEPKDKHQKKPEKVEDSRKGSENETEKALESAQESKTVEVSK